MSILDKNFSIRFIREYVRYYGRLFQNHLFTLWDSASQHWSEWVVLRISIFKKINNNSIEIFNCRLSGRLPYILSYKSRNFGQKMEDIFIIWLKHRSEKVSQKQLFFVFGRLRLIWVRICSQAKYELAHC